MRRVSISRLLALLLLEGLVWTTSPAQTSPDPPKAPQQNAAASPPRLDPKKARRDYQKGLQAEISGNWKAAIEAYALAASEDPAEPDYSIHRDLARSRVVQALVDRAERDAVSDRLPDAEKQLREALEVDPGDSLVRERYAQMRAIAQGGRPPGELPAEGEVRLEPQPGTREFDFRGDVQGAFTELARQFGLDVAFDSDLRAQSVRFQVSAVDFPTAMRLLTTLTNTFWRPLTRRMFFVAENTPQKRREFDVSLLRTIELPASATPEEVTEITRAIREITGITRTEIDAARHTMTLRASPAALALASELADELERPRGEVILDMQVLTVDRNAARQLGILPPTSGRVFTISSQQLSEAAQSAQNLADILSQLLGSPTSLAGLLSGGIPTPVAFGGGKTTFFSVLPGAAANFSQSLSLVLNGRRILLRAQDGQPATFFVGDRFPITLNQFAASLSSGISTTSTGSLNFPRSDFPTGKGPAAVATGKFDTNNANDATDLAVVNQTDGTVSILLNSGSGRFTSVTGTPPSTGTLPDAIVAGSFNPNNPSDLTDLAVANFNCTGTPLVCGPGSLTILLANGDATFSPAPGTPPATGKGPVALARGQFNLLSSSDHTDLAVVNQVDGTVTILLAKGDGTFTEAAGSPITVGTNPSAIAVGDFNGDGFPDLAVTNEGDNTVSILLGKGDGTFAQATGSPIQVGTSPTGVVAAALTGNGILDLAVANSADNTVSVMLGVGNGTFGSRTNISVGTDPVAIAAADFNDDGRTDLATVNKTSNTISILLGLGNGDFLPQIAIQVGTSPTSIATAAFTGTGLTDAAVTNFDDNTVSIILNLITTLAQQSATSQAFPGTQYVDLGVKIKATPRLHPNNDVSVQLTFEVTSLGSQSFNGIPVINNRSVAQTVRLHADETSVLSGILEDQEIRSLTGTPGLASAGVLGNLFGTRNPSRQATELLVLLTPRILRPAIHAGRILYTGREPLSGATTGPQVAPVEQPSRVPQ